MAEKETKSCSDCIHYDACYKIEHYGQSPETTALLCELYIDKNDVAPVKHGHWISEYDCGYITPHCSECGETALTKEETSYDYVYSSYCPRCGTKMGGEGE